MKSLLRLTPAWSFALALLVAGCGQQTASLPGKTPGEAAGAGCEATHEPTAETPSAPPEQGAPSTAPSPLARGNLVGKEPDLAEFNRWAAEAGLRNDLAAWVTQGLPILPDVATELSIVFNRVEMPDGATVTLIQDGYLDDSIRGEKFVFVFARTPCDDCASGMSPWQLVSLEATQRCREGRGHLDYSTEACG